VFTQIARQQAALQRMWFRGFTWYQLCENCSWKGVTYFKMYYLIVIGYTVVKVLRIYLFMEKNVKDRGRKSLNIIEE
jgi:hypothetical protein